MGQPQLWRWCRQGTPGHRLHPGLFHSTGIRCAKGRRQYHRLGRVYRRRRCGCACGHEPFCQFQPGDAALLPERRHWRTANGLCRHQDRFGRRGGCERLPVGRLGCRHLEQGQRGHAASGIGPRRGHRAFDRQADHRRHQYLHGDIERQSGHDGAGVHARGESCAGCASARPAGRQCGVSGRNVPKPRCLCSPQVGWLDIFMGHRI